MIKWFVNVGVSPHAHVTMTVQLVIQKVMAVKETIGEFLNFGWDILPPAMERQRCL